MSDLKKIIANNISELRRAFPLTQAELAEKLNYSDKAVSKWERGESMPDIEVLKQIADLFGVSVDYLLSETHDKSEPHIPRLMRRNRLIIAGLSCMLVLLVATVIVAALMIATETTRYWLAYVYAVPVCAVVLIVFNSVWGKRALNFFLISVLVWGLLAGIYLGIGDYDKWPIFLIGIPAQVIIVMWSGIKRFLKRSPQHTQR